MCTIEEIFNSDYLSYTVSTEYLQYYDFWKDCRYAQYSQAYNVDLIGVFQLK